MAGDGPAKIAQRAEIAAAGALGECKLPARRVEPEDDCAADDAAEQRAEQNCEKRAAQAEERADHGHHFHVAHAHAFAAAPEFVKLGDAPEEEAAEGGADEASDQAENGEWQDAMKKYDTEPVDVNGIGWRGDGGEEEPEHEARPVDEIGQETHSKIGDREHNDQASEDEPFQGGDGESILEIADDEKASRGELDQRIHRRNRKSAGAALAAQPEPAEDGNVVVGLNRLLAAGAARTRGYDRQTLWNPRDADVQKAAENDAK